MLEVTAVYSLLILFLSSVNTFEWRNHHSGCSRGAIHWGQASVSCKKLCDNDFGAPLIANLWKYKLTGNVLKGQVSAMRMNLLYQRLLYSYCSNYGVRNTQPGTQTFLSFVFPSHNMYCNNLCSLRTYVLSKHFFF